jgi:putative membrane protein
MVGMPYGAGKFFMGLGPLGGFLSLLILILAIVLLFKIVRLMLTKTCAISDKNDSLEILKNRLAKGQISQEEYQRMYEFLKV